MMILIVGGAGYIGAHTNKALHECGRETVVYDSLVTGHREFVRWGEFVEGDLGNVRALRACLGDYPIDTVMHFGAFSLVGESLKDPASYYRNNVVNTLGLLEAMREFQVKYFVFSSTAAIFGMPDEVPISEDHRQRPISPYGRSKLMIEQILADYDRAYGIKHINLRYFNAAGADPEGQIGERHEPETHLIPLVIAAALGRQENIRIFGSDYPTSDGTCIRDYIHVSDLATAHVKALDYLIETGQSDSFNLGNGQGHSVREVVETVRKVSARDFPIVEAPRRQGDPPVLVSSSEKAERLLQWTSRFADMETIVQTAWDWHGKESALIGRQGI